MFEASEIRAMVDGQTIEGVGGLEFVKPTTVLRAMILLGVNRGYGNTDCGTLPLSALDLKNYWINYHRPKTGITWRNPLWSETVAALEQVMVER